MNAMTMTTLMNKFNFFIFLVLFFQTLNYSIFAQELTPEINIVTHYLDKYALDDLPKSLKSSDSSANMTCSSFSITSLEPIYNNFYNKLLSNFSFEVQNFKNRKPSNFSMVWEDLLDPKNIKKILNACKEEPCIGIYDFNANREEKNYSVYVNFMDHSLVQSKKSFIQFNLIEAFATEDVRLIGPDIMFLKVNFSKTNGSWSMESTDHQVCTSKSL